MKKRNINPEITIHKYSIAGWGKRKQYQLGGSIGNDVNEFSQFSYSQLVLSFQQHWSDEWKRG